jgi:hypothetical protein
MVDVAINETGQRQSLVLENRDIRAMVGSRVARKAINNAIARHEPEKQGRSWRVPTFLSETITTEGAPSPFGFAQSLPLPEALLRSLQGWEHRLRTSSRLLKNV